MYIFKYIRIHKQHLQEIFNKSFRCSRIEYNKEYNEEYTRTIVQWLFYDKLLRGCSLYV